MTPTSLSIIHGPAPLDSILIIGAGVFGLSTTLSLLTSGYAYTKITLLDPYLPTLSTSHPSPSAPSPNSHAASIDSSRIIRPDYALPPYAKLASQAQNKWRRGYGGEGVYRESGVILSAETGGSEYVGSAMGNAQGLGYRVEGLGSKESVQRVLGTGGEGGERGYVNWGSGWADAGRAMEGCMEMAVEAARERNGKEQGQVVFKRGRASKLIVRNGNGKEKRRVVGATLDDGSEILADLTIVAAGAWSGALVDLRGRAEARGQVLAYLSITDEEKERLKGMPVVLNLSTGMFAIPPIDSVSALPPAQKRRTGDWVLKVARHAFGYANPTAVAPEGEDIVVSVPAKVFSPIPVEGEKACRSFLQQTIPWLGDRPFSSTRICWYTDTPTGDFLIDYHPKYEGLFLATGGSGHGFKFLPVLGDKIVSAIEGRLEEEFAKLWRWPREKVLPFRGCEDGSRLGDRGMILEQEWVKSEGKWEG
ncbi:MAG: hypothetical protein ALECFALPRED_005627 [Alectoria fallacina]|uniref:FAD dependent oxidoreductase domain-containing protein n=1 Tax=Alectoria fallacina TaxID=1903189 RepID=A0A8H3G5T6_9LECA|nr:MAG: hypothetical protein ALECFALPRED_005627 [Alectoria fallacina]